MPTPTETPMGRIITTLTIINRIDQANAGRGLIPAEEVRSITLDNVLVDTGATTLCLPSSAIAQLGLELLKEVDVATTNGFSKARVFQDAMHGFHYWVEKEPLNVSNYPEVAIP